VTLPFLDLSEMHRPLQDHLRAAADRVFAGSQYILGPELEAFEQEFAAFCGVRHCIGVGNGMQAIELGLRAFGVGPGDEVVTVSHTAFPTVAAVTAAGATPVLVDVQQETFCIDPDAVAAAIGPKTKAIVPVHLYGRCADMDAINALAADAGIPVLEDCAQAHGASRDGRRAGTMSAMAAFSFYPTKNLGAFGDAGAVVTDDDELALAVRRLRNYGEDAKNVNVVKGFNSRLDELQAAFLRVKLPHVEAWNAERRAIAAIYDERLADVPGVTAPEPDPGHVYHLYVVRSAAGRQALRDHLADAGIGTHVHYPTPVHLQEAYREGARISGSMAETERLTGEIVSLPAHPGLPHDAANAVADAVRAFGA
jgi:dTDP-3-amino-3,4,6-trideoxy-alpha-D-glucose transaminase